MSLPLSTRDQWCIRSIIVEIQDEHSGDSLQAQGAVAKIVAFPTEDTERIRRITAAMRDGDEAAFATNGVFTASTTVAGTNES